MKSDFLRARSVRGSVLALLTCAGCGAGPGGAGAGRDAATDVAANAVVDGGSDRGVGFGMDGGGTGEAGDGGADDGGPPGTGGAGGVRPGCGDRDIDVPAVTVTTRATVDGLIELSRPSDRFIVASEAPTYSVRVAERKSSWLQVR